jgi:hypothetical protein
MPVQPRVGRSSQDRKEGAATGANQRVADPPSRQAERHERWCKTERVTGHPLELCLPERLLFLLEQLAELLAGLLDRVAIRDALSIDEVLLPGGDVSPTSPEPPLGRQADGLFEELEVCGLLVLEVENSRPMTIARVPPGKAGGRWAERTPSFLSTSSIES